MAERPDLDAGDLPYGTILRRRYDDEEHVVEVVRWGGFLNTLDAEQRAVTVKRGWWRYMYRGKRYKTLSAITTEITGNYTLSGNRFFGLWRRKS